MRVEIIILRIVTALLIAVFGWAAVGPMMVNNSESDILMVFGFFFNYCIVPLLIYWVAINPFVKLYKKRK